MSSPRSTDWDSYYHSPYRLSGITRYFTNRILARSIRRNLSSPSSIVELGGGGSAFHIWLQHQFNPDRYVIVDNNQAGLDKLRSAAELDKSLVLINHDIVQPVPVGSPVGEVVFSVGLIEHFPANLTERAIAVHFDWATPNGLIIITYPTPTWLYRLSRQISERMGWWIFHDEAPLKLDRVSQLLQSYGQILEHRINWFTPFTQAIVVVRRFK